MVTSLSVGDAVAVTVLSSDDEPIGGSVERHDGHYLKLSVDCALPAGAPIKVEGSGAMFLGEVTACGFEHDHFSVSLEIKHALFDTEELARLASRLLAGSD